jgi:hypothetical protein
MRHGGEAELRESKALHFNEGRVVLNLVDPAALAIEAPQHWRILVGQNCQLIQFFAGASTNLHQVRERSRNIVWRGITSQRVEKVGVRIEEIDAARRRHSRI